MEKYSKPVENENTQAESELLQEISEKQSEINADLAMEEKTSGKAKDMVEDHETLLQECDDEKKMAENESNVVSHLDDTPSGNYILFTHTVLFPC